MRIIVYRISELFRSSLIDLLFEVKTRIEIWTSMLRFVN